jgi:VWFA-related protein
MKITVPAAVPLLAVCVSVAAAQQPSPQPPVTFRLEVNYVEVDASVTDAQGKPVTDLSVSDFEVLEDGRPQNVTAFSIVNLPVERVEQPLFAPAPIEPDVQTNTASEGRIYVIVLDDLHTTFSSTTRVRKAVRAFIEQNFGANDRAAVVFTSGGAQEFTNSRGLLLQAADRFSGRKLRAEALEMAGRTSRFGDSSLRTMDPLEAERAHNARSTLDSIRQLSEFMRGVRGRRKAMLLVSEGISYDIYNVMGNSSASIITQETRDAIAAATRANVAIYAIDPRGLGAFDEIIEVGSTQSENSDASVLRGLLDAQRLAQESLRVLANETGGYAAVNRNDFTDAFARVVRENSTYYVLGYYSTNERRDGRFRRLEVRVKRPGLQVRSRRGYVAPRGRPAESRTAASPGTNPLAVTANDALASPIPVSGIPIEVSAAAYKGTAPNAAVALVVQLRVDDFRFTEKNDTLVDALAVAFTPVDAAGKARGAERHVLEMAMKPDSVARARERGFRVVSQIDVPPGRYQLRVAAAEQGAGRVGTVIYDLDVPDFYKPGLTMSGVTVTSASTASIPTVLPKTPLADVLPAPPTTAREFDRSDVLTLFAELYENAPNAPPHGLDLSTTVRAEGGRVVFEDREERSSTDLQWGRGGHGYAVSIPLADLAPGSYVIHVEGRSRAGGAEAGIGRDVVIRIR